MKSNTGLIIVLAIVGLFLVLQAVGTIMSFISPQPRKATITATKPQ